MKYVSDGDQEVETSDRLAAAVVRAAAGATAARITEVLTVPTADEFGQATYASLAVGNARTVVVRQAPDDGLEYAWPDSLPSASA